uniref:M-zodatoxin-Lt2a n=1 Tax=Lachesana tarabaevi TaxID=379576 RepID=LAT2A_LACTA|nr:RecName: Full=M-zodatoxin-Lt2a; Short=M-ZDTX-Lt2a; AltName: Full=Latarcin-2a; Short=Ltc-2a; Short=Ltc2a; Flags: Precursor [Lachesana tarabaevi]CAJ81658.1 latarcin 2a precursor, pLtc 2a [Lachesana tarabaevi]
MKYFVIALALAVALVCIAESTAYEVNEELENELDDLDDAAWLAVAEELQGLEDFEESRGLFGKLIKKFGRKAISYAVKKARGKH